MSSVCVHIGSNFGSSDYWCPDVWVVPCRWSFIYDQMSEFFSWHTIANVLYTPMQPLAVSCKKIAICVNVALVYFGFDQIINYCFANCSSDLAQVPPPPSPCSIAVFCLSSFLCSPITLGLRVLRIWFLEVLRLQRYCCIKSPFKWSLVSVLSNASAEPGASINGNGMIILMACLMGFNCFKHD